MNWINKKGKFGVLGSSLIKNSAWGIFSNILQTLFVGLFFAIIARKYNSSEFAQFLIATTVYQIVAAFSSMGLGQWFIREYVVAVDRLELTSKFLKTQIGLGFIFYLINIVLAYLIYPDGQIRLLCIILGTNIIFDNLINAIRSLNVAESNQKKTATILVIDGFLKLLIGCLLFINPFSAVTLSVFLIGVRILTLSLFIRLGSSDSIDLRLLWHAKIAYDDLRKMILKNWQFIVIGSISVIYWRIGNIIISKFLSLQDVADYEIAFRFFSVLQILPIIASATVFPQFRKYFNEGNLHSLRRFYQNLFVAYVMISVIAYAFIYSYSDILIPLIFGNGYLGSIVCLQQMFLTFLVLPTVLLQANLIVAIGLEKLDMWYNIIGLIINILGCVIGLYLFKSLSVINYSILLSFVFFHIAQDRLLIKKKFTSLKNCLIFYFSIIIFCLSYYYLTKYVNPYIFFITFSGILICSFLLVTILKNRKGHSLMD